MRRIKRLTFLGHRLALGCLMDLGAFTAWACDEVLYRLDQWEGK
jgi:hypothetical protein